MSRKQNKGSDPVKRAEKRAARRAALQRGAKPTESKKYQPVSPSASPLPDKQETTTDATG